MAKSDKKYKKTWFYGKTVVITGGGSGFGKLLCEKLVTRYACTVIAIGRTENKLLSLKNEFEKIGSGDKFFYKTFDAGLEQNWIDFACELKKRGACIDVLINNAGVLPPFSRFEKQEAEVIEQAFSSNFFAQVYSVKHLLPLIKRSTAGGKRFSGAIINVSSSACLASVVGTAAYSASKSASAAFTKILSLENAGVYVSLVMPGFASTNIFRSQKNVSDKESGLIAKVCGDPDKMTDKMLKAFVKNKKRVVIGTDAHAMSFFGRFFPKTCDKAIRFVLKKANLDIFSDVFD